MFACVHEKNILIPDLCISRPANDCVVSNAPLQIIFQLISIDEKWKLYPFALYFNFTDKQHFKEGRLLRSKQVKVTKNPCLYI